MACDGRFQVMGEGWKTVVQNTPNTSTSEWFSLSVSVTEAGHGSRIIVFFARGEKKCLVRWVLFAILATERLVLSFSIILREIIIIENDLKISRSLMEVCFVIHHNYSLVCKHNKSDTQKIGSIFCPTYYKWITRSSYRRDTVSMSQVLKDFDNILRSANMTGQLPRDRK